MKKKKIILYHTNPLKFGGVDTFDYNFCKKLKDKYDITFLYKEGVKSTIDRLKDLGIDVFYLCGGAQINALFFQQDLVDEISLVICPGIQGGRNELTFVGGDDISAFPKYFKVKNVEVLEGNTIHLTYMK